LPDSSLAGGPVDVPYVFLLSAVVLLAAGQIAQKIAAEQVFGNGFDAGSPGRLLRCRHFWWALLSLAAGTAMWLITLSALEVSTAYPILSLSFVLTVLSAKMFLNERVSRARWIGVIMICAGTALVATG
jgi:drug/metabolite transporter (DMT)-like permease